MSVNVSFIIQAIDEFTPAAKTVANSLDKIQTQAKAASSAVNNVEKGLKASASAVPAVEAVAESINKVEKRSNAAIKSLRKFERHVTKAGRTASRYLTLPLVGLGGIALKAAADVESIGLSFEVLLKSKSKADALMADLIELTKATPFGLKDMEDSARELLGSGIPFEKILPNLRMMGDLAAGANIPLTDMVHILATAKNKGKIGAEELNQMAKRGLPVVEELARMAGTSTERIYKGAENGQITFKVLEHAFKNLTKEGGRFYQMSIRQSETLAGIFGTLGDVVYYALRDIGQAIVDAFEIKPKMTKLIEWIEQFQVNLKNFIKNNPGLSKFILIFLGLLAILGPSLIGIGLFIKMLGLAAIGFKALLLPIKLVGAALKLMFLSPLGLVIIAIAALVIGLVYAYNKFEPFRRIVDGVVDTFLNFWKAIWDIINPLKLVSGLGKILYDHFLPFKLLIDGITWIFENWPMIIEKAGAAFSGLAEKVKPFTDKTGSILSSAAGAFDNTNNSPSLMSAPSPMGGKNGNATVTININDKNNTVKSVETNTKKGVDLAVGKNMRNV